MMNPVEQYLREFEEYGIAEEPIWAILRWASSKAQTPEEATKILRNALGRRSRRKEWEDDILLDTFKPSPLLLEALAWLQAQE